MGKNGLERYGGWALITGASSGIGAAFAREIAVRGVSCVLVARRRARLEALRDEILATGAPVEIRIVVQDLAASDATERIVRATGDLPIGILVNNAGFGDGGRFERRDRARIEEMIQVNCAAPVLLTHACLPAMLERRRGAIVMVSSALGLAPAPYEALYGATKAFDLSFGGGLWGELKRTGVDAITVCPARTATEFAVAEGFTAEEAAEIYRHAAPASHIARITLAALGRRPVVVAREGKFLNAARRLMTQAMMIRALGNNLAKRFANR